MSIVEGMSDPAILLDRDLGHVAHNPAYASLAGMRGPALLRRLKTQTCFDLLGVNGERDGEYARRCIASGKPIQLAEQLVRNANGDQIIAYVTFVPVAQEDEIVGVIQYFRDVSAEARVQERYKELLRREQMRAENLEREIEERTRELTAALEEVTRLSRVDPLTNLLNRRAFTELAEQALKLAKRHNRHMAILIADLDHFKKINDSYGHQAGDAILVSTSRVLTEAVRDSDPVARFGGEEFVVLLTETAPGASQIVGERIRARVEAIGLESGPSEPSPTASIGVAVYPEHGDTLDELISRADQALYRAKETGRNQAILYSEKDFSESSPPNASSRRQVLLVGSRRADALVDCLLRDYDVLVADDEEEALGLCRRDRLDAIVADHPSVDDGVEFLRRTLRYRPEALRVLVIDSQDVFLEVRGSNLARIDSFLLRGELVEHLGLAIDDGLARRELDRSKLLFSTDSVKRLFSSRLIELDHLIDTHDFDFAYQPIVDPRTGELKAYEALCRARHPIFCNATVLFEAAVQSGALWNLGRVTRRVAIEGLKRIPEGVKLFVNLHPGEVDDPEIRDIVSSEEARRVVFEITERAAIPDFQRFHATAQELVAAGYRFAIDDLGAGYASLNAVALLAPDFIKIDMTMVRGIDTAPRRAKLVKRVVDFANDIGIKVVAEGIERSEEAEVVAEIGCHFAQGYYYGRPGPLREK